MRYKKEEVYDYKIVEKTAKSYKGILQNIGEDVNREGLLKTPERASKAMQFLTQGYDLNAEEILRGALFTEDTKEMVIVKNIELYSFR